MPSPNHLANRLNLVVVLSPIVILLQTSSYIVKVPIHSVFFFFVFIAFRILLENLFNLVRFTAVTHKKFMGFLFLRVLVNLQI